MIFGKIFELNSAKYGPLIEHDLFEIMNKSSVGFIFPFFDITIQEMQGEEDNEKEILHCNFDSPLKSEKLPLTWWTNKQFQNIRTIEKEQDQEIEIINKLVKEQESKQHLDMPYEVLHSVVNFQNIQLGEKIRKINKMAENDAAYSLENFEYEFSELNVAEMMHVE